MQDKYYVTTPIYYVNDKPHIGHAYTTIIADILARYKRLQGKDVLFLTGTDEHGEKIKRAAEEAEKDPQIFVDELAPTFKKAWKKINISYDQFIRTTDEKHEKIVKKFVNEIFENEDIYQGKYEGWYCVPCETFWPERKLVDGKCPECERPVEQRSHETYFFKLSDFEEKLLNHYEKNPEFVIPETRRNEMLNRIEEGLEDLSITRKDLDWAVEFPQSQEHGIYVWVDALTNYISALDYPSKKFEKYWPADHHVIGKDITWFHTVIWPALLFSAGLDLPDSVLVNGFWTREGEKMSKSKGNVVDPVKMSEKYSADAFRYFLIRQKTIGEDGDFSENDLITRYNNELANTVGNFVHRTLTFIQNNFENKVPKGDKDQNLAQKIQGKVDKITSHLDKADVNRALKEIISLARVGNEYFQKCEPWNSKKEEAAECLYNCANLVDDLSVLLYPFIPNSAGKIFDMMNLESGRIKYLEDYRINSGHEIGGPEILFEKIEPEVKEEKEEVKEEMISFEEFQELDLRIGRVENVEEIEKADNLYRLQIDVGGEIKQSVAGLKGYYSIDELEGEQVPVLVNLEPSELMGVKSECMILAAAIGDDEPVLLKPEREIETGSEIK